MPTTIKKSALVSLFIWMAFCLYPATSWPALAVKTEVISGIIVQKLANNAVELDNGKIYQPSREGLVVNLQEGEPVSLRYYIEDSVVNVFFEFAPGLNSLKNLEPTTAKKNNIPE